MKNEIKVIFFFLNVNCVRVHDFILFPNVIPKILTYTNKIYKNNLYVKGNLFQEKKPKFYKWKKKIKLHEEHTFYCYSNRCTVSYRQIFQTKETKKKNWINQI